ncbi:hypothetical protein EVA_10235, partial [gut metagenome]
MNKLEYKLKIEVGVFSLKNKMS